MTVNKGFIYGLLDQDDGAEEEGNKYDFLSQTDELGGDSVDFQDPAALLRRQKKILEKIEKHQN